MEHLIKEVLSYSQHTELPHITELLDKWRKAKQPLMDFLLRGKIIYEHPEKLSFELSQSAKEERFSSFVEYVRNLLEFDYNDPFIEFLATLKPQEFYDNCLNSDFWITTEKKIPKGSKIIRSFKYFFTDPKILADLQNKASILIQENKVEGYLCLSVHPLDFLSLSENACNWRSCHALDGEYRCGNLSYMLDSATVVCYLRSEQEANLPNFPSSISWNNKKWRCLLFVSDDHSGIFAGKQYPFFSPGALEKVRQVLVRECMNFNERNCFEMPPEKEWSHWHDDYINESSYSEYSEDYRGIVEDKYFTISGQIYDIRKIMTDATESRHFNDVLRSSVYLKPFYMFQNRFYRWEEPHFTIGSEVNCLKCGQALVRTSDTMMCPECTCNYGENVDPETYPYCDCCGARFWAATGWWAGDCFVCSHCSDTECFTCEDCGELHFNDEKHYDEDSQKFLCNTCYENRRK